MEPLRPGRPRGLWKRSRGAAWLFLVLGGAWTILGASYLAGRDGDPWEYGELLVFGVALFALGVWVYRRSEPKS